MQRHKVTSLETSCSLANGPSWGGGGGGVCGAEEEVCILFSPGIAASPISLLSMGGVCGRTLTAGKILFTGRQTCSLYLVLWLCGYHSYHLVILLPQILFSNNWQKAISNFYLHIITTIWWDTLSQLLFHTNHPPIAVWSPFLLRLFKNKFLGTKIIRW